MQSSALTEPDNNGAAYLELFIVRPQSFTATVMLPMHPVNHSGHKINIFTKWLLTWEAFTMNLHKSSLCAH